MCVLRKSFVFLPFSDLSLQCPGGYYLWDCMHRVRCIAGMMSIGRAQSSVSHFLLHHHILYAPGEGGSYMGSFNYFYRWDRRRNKKSILLIVTL